MRNLNEYIKESILDDENTLVNNIDIENEQWVRDNYNVYKVGRNGTDEFTIKNGVLNAINTGFSVKVRLKELTNGKFEFGEVGEFSCSSCPDLKNLIGGPKQVKSNFDAINCRGLKDLKGAPEHVGAEFNCSDCDNLKYLTGSPKYVGTDLDISNCENLKSLKGLPEYIGGDILCHGTPGIQYNDNIRYIKNITINGNIEGDDDLWKN